MSCKILSLAFLFVQPSVSFGMIKFEELPLVEQGLHTLRWLYKNYKNQDNLELMNNFILNEKNYVPVVFLDTSPLVTRNQIILDVIDPYLFYSDDKITQIGFNRFIEGLQVCMKKRKKQAAMIGVNNNQLFITYNVPNNPLIAAILLGDKKDVVRELKNIKELPSKGQIIDQAIKAIIDYPYVRKSIFTLLLNAKKILKTESSFDCYQLLKVAAKNKDVFTLIAQIDPCCCKKNDNQAYTTIVDRMYKNDNFDLGHIKIFKERGWIHSAARLPLEEGKRNLETVYKNQKPNFVKKFLGDTSNYVPILLVNKGPHCPTNPFSYSLINPYDESFYPNTKQQFTQDIIAIGKKRLDTALADSQHNKNNNSIEINNPFVVLALCGNTKNVEKQLIKNFNNPRKSIKSIEHDLNKAIGALIVYQFNYDTLKSLLLEQKMLQRKHSDYNDSQKGLLSYNLLSLAAQHTSFFNIKAFHIVSYIDPYSTNRLPWKLNNETEYKTNADRIALDHSFSTDHRLLFTITGGLTTHLVHLYNEKLVGDIIKNLPSRYDTETRNIFVDNSRIVNNTQKRI